MREFYTISSSELVARDDVIALVDCPACGGQGWCIPRAKVGHWLGLMPWPANARVEDCALCDGTGAVPQNVAMQYEQEEGE